ncbi:MAG: hypothetical protein LBH27_02885 [Endomicrobium sp.]|nr:hypothetical protein [Endomicrobium sp.]
MTTRAFCHFEHNHFHSINQPEVKKSRSYYHDKAKAYKEKIANMSEDEIIIDMIKNDGYDKNQKSNSVIKHLKNIFIIVFSSIGAVLIIAILLIGIILLVGIILLERICKLCKTIGVRELIEKICHIIHKKHDGCNENIKNNDDRHVG